MTMNLKMFFRRVSRRYVDGVRLTRIPVESRPQAVKMTAGQGINEYG